MSYTVKKYGDVADAITILFRLPIRCHNTEKWQKECLSEDSDEGSDSPRRAPEFQHPKLGPEDPALDTTLATTERDPSVRTHIMLAQKNSASAIFFGRHSSSRPDVHDSSPTMVPKGKFIVVVEHQTTSTDLIEEEPNIEAYKVYSSLQKDDAMQAVTIICQTLEPIANILLSEAILKALILPTPKMAKESAHIIVSHLMVQGDKIDSDEWKTLATVLVDNRLLVYHSCMLNSIGMVKSLIENGANPLAMDPDTHDTLVHMAVKHGNQLLVELLDLIQATVPTAAFTEYINRTNKDSSASLKRLQKRVSTSQMQQVLKKKSSVLLAKQQSRGRVSSFVQEEPRTRRVSLPASSMKAPKLGFRRRLSDPDQAATHENTAGSGGITALILACGQSDTLSVLYLLLYGADPNIKDPAKGTTALHVAAYCGYINIVKLLLAFNADMDAVNCEGKNPLSLAQESNEIECLRLMEHVKGLQKKVTQEPQLLVLQASKPGAGGLEESANLRDEEEKDDDDNEVKSKLNDGVTNSSDSTNLNILSLDGGGFRCALFAYLLYVIEQRMRTLQGNSSVCIGSCFNWITAISMSSILATRLALRSSCGALELIKVAIKSIEKLQDDATNFDDYLKEVFETNTLIEGIQERNILLMTAVTSSQSTKLVHISNYRPQQGRGWKIRDAIRACSTNASCVINGESYSDGSVIAMNPTLYALNDTEIYHCGQDPTLVLSLGHTPSLAPSSPKTPPSTSSSDSFQAAAADEAVSLSQDWCINNKVAFVRLSPSVPINSGYTTIYEADLVSMLFETFLYCLKSHKTIDNVAQLLLLSNGKP